MLPKLEKARRKLRALSMQGYKGVPTPFERAVAEALPFAVQCQVRIGRYRVDLYEPQSRLVVECDNGYWHSSPRAKARDRRKDRYLRAHGHSVVRIQQKVFKRNPQRAIAIAVRKAGAVAPAT